MLFFLSPSPAADAPVSGRCGCVLFTAAAAIVVPLGNFDVDVEMEVVDAADVADNPRSATESRGP